jgi:hypothetical protein
VCSDEDYAKEMAYLKEKVDAGGEVSPSTYPPPVCVHQALSLFLSLSLSLSLHTLRTPHSGAGAAGREREGQERSDAAAPVGTMRSRR